jgi:hypothetical protein
MAKVTLTIKSDAMKSFLPLLTFAILLTSCSSVYKSGQTPDDVYFSPERPREEYVRTNNRNDRRYQQIDEEAREDRYLRMKARNRRYELLDDYDYYAYNGANYYRYNDYYRMNAFRFHPTWGTWNYRFGGLDPFFYNPYYYNSFYFNPYYHNPYYSGVVYGNVNPKFNRPRTTNLHVFDANGNRYNSNVPRSNGRTFSTGSDRNDNYRNSGSNAGGFMRNVFGGENSGSNKTPSSSAGSSNSGSSSGSSGSSGSSRAPVRRF